MTINQIPEGSEFVLKINEDGHVTDVSVKVTNISDSENKSFDVIRKQNPNMKFVILDAVRQDGKTVGFTYGQGIIYSLTGTVEQKYYAWENILIKNFKSSAGKVYHLAFSPQDIKPLNRRNAYRLWIGESIEVTQGLSKDRKQAVLKDLSASGMGVIVADPEGYRIEGIIHVLYEDQELNTRLNLSGKIVNIINLEAGKILIGCQFFNASPEIEKFINHKQIMRAKSKNR